VEFVGVGDIGSEDSTVVDVATLLEGPLNMSLRSVCFADETWGPSFSTVEVSGFLEYHLTD
jgi:hypothetical protein